MNENDIIKEELVYDSKNILTEDEARKLYELQKKYLESYAINKDKMEVKEWLVMEMKSDLPEKKEEEIEEMAVEIIENIKINDENIKSIQKASKRGVSNEEWFVKKLKESMPVIEVNKMGDYLSSIDEAIGTANENLINQITTKSGLINQNPNLDGFIAEQKLAESFNLKAALEGSEYRAEVLSPDIYNKNSVDIVIKDKMGLGSIAQRYQVKFGKTAENTIQYIKEGNYNNQRLIVPKEQVEVVQNAFPNKTVTSSIGGTEKVPIKGKEYEKMEMKSYQNEIQSGNIEKVEYTWDEYAIKDLSRNIAKKAGTSAFLSAGCFVLYDVVEKIAKDEEIKGNEVIEGALFTGMDSGAKVATAGAIKVASEKGFINVIPKGTAMCAITAIATVVVENVKILAQIGGGELTIREGLGKMAETTTAIGVGTIAAGKGAALGATLGLALGAPGAAVGAVLGGGLGYMVGSEFGKKVVQTCVKVKNTVKEVVHRVVETVKDFGNACVNVLESAWSGVKSFFSFW